MPFDPAQPANNSPLSSQVMRDQLTSLKALIDVVVGIIAAQVDGVTTLNSGDPASATVAVVGNELHFTFAIPKGNDGGQGIQGIPGTDGTTGAQGPPFAQAIVDAVNTLAPGSAATVSVSFDGTFVHFVFGIPSGLQGIPGVDGAPGEVTNAALATAISGTSNNTNAVATLDTAPSDPPSFADYEALRAKMNELILNGRR